MGFFDFLKKKEFAKIEDLKKQIDKKNSEISQLEYLKKFKQIADAEKEAERILFNAKTEAEQIISSAKTETERIRNEAIEILKIANKRKLDINNRSEEIISNAKEQAKLLNQQANDKLNEASIQAKTIIENSEKQAEKIAGDAYNALKQADSLEQTVKALQNKVKGYGDEYIIPTYSLLDELADDFGYSEAGQELKKARERSRLMIKNRLAAKCEYVENNRKTTAINFATDAFNGKVDTILSSVRHNNFGTLKRKIIDSYHLVNNLGQAFRNAIITEQYLNARIDELKWAVITTELKKQERDEQRRIKEQIREEERAKREFERALKESEKQEEMLKKAMEKAQQKINTATEAQRKKYEHQLLELKERLKVAEEKGQRALSMAQQTRSGHVYIISNIGSFGENVYKIGMTRRLEPTDRVKELGDASVPFPFDIHAMIYSKDAPSLERELHKNFLHGQVNKVNSRKEFFRIYLSDIKNKVADLNLNAKWTILSEATEYRETIAIEKQMRENNTVKKEWEYNQMKKYS